MVKKRVVLTIALLPCILFLFSCKKENKKLYTMGIFQVNDAPTLNDVKKGFIHAIEENGYVDGENIKLIKKNANGNIQQLQRIAKDFVLRNVDLLVPFSTPSFQAALHATNEIPIVFSSVANPYLVGAGRSSESHLSHITGVSSRGPIKESLEFIKKIKPNTKRIGTLYTPSEINSNYYLDLVQKGAEELDFTVIAVPITKSSDVLLSAQELVNNNIDVIYQISDNTINASFKALSRVADENKIPLFGGFLLATRYGACAALGWDFFDMGFKAGVLAIRVLKGDDPASIPIENMKKISLHLNMDAALRQGIQFSDEVINKADNVIKKSENNSSH